MVLVVRTILVRYLYNIPSKNFADFLVKENELCLRMSLCLIVTYRESTSKEASSFTITTRFESLVCSPAPSQLPKWEFYLKQSGRKEIVFHYWHLWMVFTSLPFLPAVHCVRRLWLENEIEIKVSDVVKGGNLKNENLLYKQSVGVDPGEGWKGWMPLTIGLRGWAMSSSSPIVQ